MKSFSERLSGRPKQKKKVIVVPQGTVDSEEGKVIKVPSYLKNVSTLIARSTDRGIVAQALPSFDDQYSPPRSRRQKGLRANLACQEDSESDTQDQDPNCLKAGTSCSKGDYSETEDQEGDEKAAIMPATSSPSKRQPPPFECDISAIPADVPGTRYCAPEKCTRPRSKSAQRDLSSTRRESPSGRRASSTQREPMYRDVASSTRRERPRVQSYDYGRPSNRTNILSTSLPERNQTYPPARPRTSAGRANDRSFGMRRAAAQSQLGQSRRGPCRPDQSSSYYDASSDVAGSYDPFAILSSGPYSEYSSSGYVPPCRTPIDLRASTTPQSYQFQDSMAAAQSCPCNFGSGREMNAMVAYQSAPPQLFPTGNSFGPPSGFTNNSNSMVPLFAQQTREKFAIYEDSMGSPCGRCPPLANRTPPPALMYQPPAGNISCPGPCNASANTTYYSAQSSDPSSYYSAMSSSCCGSGNTAPSSSCCCNHGNPSALSASNYGPSSSCCGGNRVNSNSGGCCGNRGNSNSGGCCGNRGNSTSFGGQQAMFPPMYQGLSNSAPGGPPCGCGR